MISSVVIIPARLNSTRLPQKPLAEIAGRPMITHVIERAQKAHIGPVCVAGCDKALQDVVTSSGAHFIMTDPQQPSGSDRVYEALDRFDPQGKYQSVINLQGDMPIIEPEAIVLLHQMMQQVHIAWDVMTLVSEIANEAAINKHSVVKVACAPQGQTQICRALYFSRNPVPWGQGSYWKHLGIYGWHRRSLGRFIHLPPSALEIREKLEQLRALEDGMNIFCCPFQTSSLSVDTPDDLHQIRQYLQSGVKRG